jgi:crossover junction endodeoxyribonuclease RusA
MLLFEFVVEGPPVSSQARRRRHRDAWQATIVAAIRARWPEGTPLIASDIAVTISHFFDAAPADVDNIPKLILDALKGVVLTDDQHVSDLIVQRRPLAGPYIVMTASPELSRGVALGREFLHVAISTPPGRGELRPHDYP